MLEISFCQRWDRCQEEPYYMCLLSAVVVLFASHTKPTTHWEVLDKPPTQGEHCSFKPNSKHVRQYLFPAIFTVWNHHSVLWTCTWRYAHQRSSRDMLEPFCHHLHSLAAQTFCISHECLNVMVELMVVYHKTYFCFILL